MRTALLLLALIGGTAAAGELFNERGLRADRYRAPLPDSVPHGQRVDAEQARALIAEKDLLLIDVQAADELGLLGEMEGVDGLSAPHGLAAVMARAHEHLSPTDGGDAE